MSADPLADYYARRAAEYEEVYRKPERQVDLRRLAELLGAALAGELVLEVACGTGYWTQHLARVARRVVATDLNTAGLALAQQKSYGSCPVTFRQADAYTLVGVPTDCTAGCHAFWWSHVPLARLPAFLRCFHAHLAAGARVVMMDNVYVEGSSTPLARRDADGNTYQRRRLRDGSEHEVLKNFPTAADLRGHLAAVADNVQVTQLTYYWFAEYRVRPA